MIKIASDNVEIINIYRSYEADDICFIEKLVPMITNEKQTIILGDFNLCYQSQRDHPIFKLLHDMKFVQLVKSPSHIEGRVLDLVFVHETNKTLTVHQKAAYFTDHDVIEIS